jgi:hypothetical protein
MAHIVWQTLTPLARCEKLPWKHEIAHNQPETCTIQEALKDITLSVDILGIKQNH